jgi:hypothetical protein
LSEICMVVSSARLPIIPNAHRLPRDCRLAVEAFCGG